MTNTVEGVELRTPLGWFLRKELANRGMTQAELAERTGFSTSYVSLVFRADTPASFPFLDAVARVLELEGEERERLFLEAYDKRGKVLLRKDNIGEVWEDLIRFYARRTGEG